MDNLLYGDPERWAVGRDIEMKLDQDISPQVKRVLEILAVKLQELVDKKYRGKVEVVFHPEGVIKGVEVPEFFHVAGSKK